MSTRNPHVQLTLVCGWCGEQAANVHGRMRSAQGQIFVNERRTKFDIAAGRPVCRHCGGPLFIEDWRVLKQHQPAAASVSLPTRPLAPASKMATDLIGTKQLCGCPEGPYEQAPGDKEYCIDKRN